MSGKVLFYLCFIVTAIAMTVYYIKSAHPLRTSLKGVIPGILSLLGVHFFGYYLNIYLTLNIFTVFIATVFGMPGVAMLVLIENYL